MPELSGICSASLMLPVICVLETASELSFLESCKEGSTIVDKLLCALFVEFSKCDARAEQAAIPAEWLCELACLLKDGIRGAGTAEMEYLCKYSNMLAVDDKRGP